MLRLLIAACTIVQLTGCVVVPTHVTPPPPTAAVSRVKLVVPQPDVGAHAVYVGEVPWHYARVTLAPVDKLSAPTTQTLGANRGNLVAAGPIANLRPGAYDVRLDLIQVGFDYQEHVVASGTQEALQLNVGGANALEVMVHPTEPTAHVALTPSVLPSSAAPYWSPTVIIHDTTYERTREVYVHEAARDDEPVLHVEEETTDGDDPWAGWDDDSYAEGYDDGDDSDDDDT